MIILFWSAFFGGMLGTLIPLVLIYFSIRKSEREVAKSKTAAMEALVQARKDAYKKAQDSIHDAIVTGKIKTVGSQSKLYPFDDDDGDKGSGSFN
jgi:hypothetical protein